MTEEDIPNLKLQECMGIHITVLRYFFYWPPEKSSGLKRRLYPIYSAFVIAFMLGCYNVCEFINMFFVAEDLETFVTATYLMYTNTAQVLKLMTIFWNLPQIKQLISDTNSEVFKPLSMVHHKIIVKAMEIYRTLATIFYGIVVFTVLFWILFPLLDVTADYRQLPFPSWYPFDTKPSPQYELTFIYQIASVFVHGTVNVSTDNTSYGIMLYLGAELDVLNDVLRDLNMYARKRIGFRERITPERISHEMNELLINCVHRHWAICKLVNDYIKAYRFVIVAQFTFGALIVCVSMYRISQMPLLSAEFGSSFLYLFSMMIQLFQYCWHGNEIMLKSGELFKSAYACEWADCSVSFKKNLLIFLMQVRRPIRVNAGFLFLLSVDTFTAIMRASWSYFTVLRSVQDK